jgi:hypothetical protein
LAYSRTALLYFYIVQVTSSWEGTRQTNTRLATPAFPLLPTFQSDAITQGSVSLQSKSGYYTDLCIRRWVGGRALKQTKLDSCDAAFSSVSRHSHQMYAPDTCKNVKWPISVFFPLDVSKHLKHQISSLFTQEPP